MLELLIELTLLCDDHDSCDCDESELTLLLELILLCDDHDSCDCEDAELLSLLLLALLLLLETLLELGELSLETSVSQTAHSCGLICSSQEQPSTLGKQMTFLQTLAMVPSILHSILVTTSTQQ